MERSAGVLWCPCCFCNREFVAWVENSDPYPPIECVVCRYEFDQSVVEDATGKPPRKVPTVDHATRDKAQRAYIREFSTRVANGGFRLRPQDKSILSEDG